MHECLPAGLSDWDRRACPQQAGLNVVKLSNCYNVERKAERYKG